MRTAVTATLLATLITATAHTGEPVNMTDLQARQDYITGRPPRIAPLPPEEYADQNLDVVAGIWDALGVTPRDELPEYFATMLKHPALMRSQVELGITLARGELSVRHRELAILRIAWLCRAPYEWGQHVKIGKREASLSSEEIDRVREGSDAPGWTPHERALIRAVEELHADAMITDETWAALAETLDERQLLELPVLVGAYQGVAYLQNAVRFRLMPDNPGLGAR